MKKETFQNDLEHIFSAYSYCVSCIPKEELFVNGQDVRVGSTKFKNSSQAYSMRIELGWAFFTRMDACMETLAHELKVQSGGTGILDYLNQQNCILSKHEQDGLKIYREIRNTLHHGDGDPSYLKKKPKQLKIKQGCEFHLLEEQMKMFYDLFKKVGKFLTKSST